MSKNKFTTTIDKSIDSRQNNNSSFYNIPLQKLKIKKGRKITMNVPNFYNQWANRIYLQWHLTNRCNNRCTHCYQNQYDGAEVSIGDATLIVEDLLDCCKAFEALPVIALTGGNPMLNNDFWKIIAEIRRQSEFGCISILGNPESLNAKTIQQLQPFKLHHFQLSIDGMEKTHDSIRHKGSFARTLRAISDLVKSGIPAYIMSTLSSVNYREMSEVMLTVYSRGARHWMFARWIPPTKGDCGIPADEYRSFVNCIMAEHEQYEKRGYKQLKKEPMISRYRSDPALAQYTVVSGGCGMGSSTITMLADKTLMACRRHPGSVIGTWSPTENFLYHFLDNPEMVKYRNITEIESCRDCKLLKYCRGCRAAAYVAFGDDNYCDPQCQQPMP